MLAQRFFLGVGKYTPNDGVSGDMGWKPPIARQWKSVLLYWSRLASMAAVRVNKRLALWALSKSNQSCKNWMFIVKQFLSNHDLQMYNSLEQPLPSNVVSDIENVIVSEYVTKWTDRINSVVGPSRRGSNKLRFYALFKTEYQPELYCKLILPPRHRAAFSKFRCGVAPIRIETGRYEGLKLDARLCPFCDNVESESHVLLHCPVYNDLKEPLFWSAVSNNREFLTLCDTDKCIFLFSNPNLIRTCAKTCFTILQRRQFLICK